MLNQPTKNLLQFQATQPSPTPLYTIFSLVFRFAFRTRVMKSQCLELNMLPLQGNNYIRCLLGTEVLFEVPSHTPFGGEPLLLSP
jgi:hypothetical protein